MSKTPGVGEQGSERDDWPKLIQVCMQCGTVPPEDHRLGCTYHQRVAVRVVPVEANWPDTPAEQAGQDEQPFTDQQVEAFARTVFDLNVAWDQQDGHVPPTWRQFWPVYRPIVEAGFRAAAAVEPGPLRAASTDHPRKCHCPVCVPPLPVQGEDKHPCEQHRFSSSLKDFAECPDCCALMGLGAEGPVQGELDLTREEMKALLGEGAHIYRLKAEDKLRAAIAAVRGEER